MSCSDNPIKNPIDDSFGFAPFAKTVAEFIENTKRLPFCLGVFGPWGTGKTSFMHLMQHYLTNTDDNANKNKTIWFYPWKYDQKEDIWHAFIQTILYAIAEDRNIGDEASKKALLLAKQSAWFLFKKGISTVTGGLVSGNTLEQVKEKFFEEDQIFHKHLNTFEEDFSKAIDLYTGEEGKLIVFIDDLDRCIPENAITVLESLKLFIGDARCIFVLGMDQHIVELGIKSRFQERIDMSGRDYLEKIIQAPFYMPPVPFNKLKTAISAEDSGAEQYTEDIWNLVQSGFHANPRKTKRFVNCFYLLNKVIKQEEITDQYEDLQEEAEIVSGLSLEEQDFYLAKLLILQIEHPTFYTFLRNHPEAWNEYERSLIHTAGVRDLERFLSNNGEYKKFWDNGYLRDFMTNTSYVNNQLFPRTPDDDVISSVMQMINLIQVEGERKYEKIKKEASKKKITERAKKKTTKKKTTKKKAKKKRARRRQVKRK